MKIGIESKGFDSWGGGIDFIRHVASAIEIADQNQHHDKHLLIARNNWRFIFKNGIPTAVARSIRDGLPVTAVVAGL